MNNINNAVDLLEKAKAILHLRSQQPKSQVMILIFLPFYS